MKHSQMSENSSVTQSYPTICNPMGCSLLDSSVHGIFPASTLLGRLLYPTPGVCM